MSADERQLRSRRIAVSAQVRDFLDRRHDSGKAFLTATVLQGTPGMRAAFSNWRTTPSDVEIVWQAMLGAVE